MTFQITIAHYTFEVQCVFESTLNLCFPYADNAAKPSAHVEVTHNDILAEHYKTAPLFPLSQVRMEALESNILHRKICDFLASQNTIMMHGSVVAVGNSAIAFTAPSGTGKTTHSRLWQDHLEGSYILNGDKPLIHVGQQVMAYGSPWCGKEGFNRNTGVPLKSICLLKRNDVNALHHISAHEALPDVLGQIHLPSEPTVRFQVIQCVDQLLRKTELFQLDMNNMKQDAFSVSSGMLSYLD